MPKRNNFQEIISAIFAIIVFIMVGSALLSSSAASMDFSWVISGFFIFGTVIIGMALLIKILKILEDLLN